jgi:ceramide glucosyltransferase
VPSFWSRVGALFIDTWFAPSVRVASALGSDAFAFGATIALRRQTLRDGGGFEAVRNRLADDYWLGAIARRRGLATVLSEVEVITEVPETRVSQLWLREVRWLRTIRALNPVGFAFLFITFTLPMAGLAIAFSTSTATVTLAAIAILARLALQVHRVGWRRLWLAPVRDALLLLEWIAACGGDRVTWRDSTLGVDQRAPTVHDLPTPPAEASSAYRKQP